MHCVYIHMYMCVFIHVHMYECTVFVRTYARMSVIIYTGITHI